MDRRKLEHLQERRLTHDRQLDGFESLGRVGSMLVA
jgi:hypothetical protein